MNKYTDIQLAEQLKRRQATIQQKRWKWWNQNMCCFIVISISECLRQHWVFSVMMMMVFVRIYWLYMLFCRQMYMHEMCWVHKYWVYFSNKLISWAIYFYFFLLFLSLALLLSVFCFVSWVYLCVKYVWLGTIYVKMLCNVQSYSVHTNNKISLKYL